MNYCIYGKESAEECCKNEEVKKKLEYIQSLSPEKRRAYVLAQIMDSICIRNS